MEVSTNLTSLSSEFKRFTVEESSPEVASVLVHVANFMFTACSCNEK